MNIVISGIAVFLALIVIWALIDWVQERRHTRRMAAWLANTPKRDKAEPKGQRLYAWEKAPYGSVVKDRFSR